ncbi:MAG: type II toxin-antitoxin system RelE/ParE family toxin [Armatimonadetes bacterium]|nr:type II toxin-antitoxin system RelE/ParE family toxin [Armatimonadota bacterium]
MSYEVRFERAADRDLDRLPAEVQRRVIQRIEALADHPRPPGAEALGGALHGLTKLRVGSYRISYEVNDEQGVVTIMEVGHRRDIYRRLQRRR